ncbi:MAG: hypothetical protein QM811_12240 [Pirellulales bacterium]
MNDSFGNPPPSAQPPGNPYEHNPYSSNPYGSPQYTQGGYGFETAPGGMPVEMREVADGMRFCLWSVFALVGGVIALAMIGAAIGITIRDQGELKARLGLATYAGIGVVVLVGGLRIFGLTKCLRAPDVTQANGLAKAALAFGIAVLVFDLVTNVLQLAGLEKLNTYLGIVNVALTAGLWISFVKFLQKIAIYLQDGYTQSQTGTLLTLTYVMTACMVVGSIVGIVTALLGHDMAQAFAQNQGARPKDFGFIVIVMLAMMIVGLGMLICGLWGVILYVQITSRLTGIIDRSTR